MHALRISPGSAPGHKLQQPLKYSGMFLSLGATYAFLAHGAMPPSPKYAPASKGLLLLLKKEKFDQRC